MAVSIWFLWLLGFTSVFARDQYYVWTWYNPYSGLNSPTHSPTLLYSYNSPTHSTLSYLYNSPTHSTLSYLYNSPTRHSPKLSYLYNSPTHSPTLSYLYNSPTHLPPHSYSYNSPTHSPPHLYLYNSPTHSPALSYLYNSPIHSYLYNSPTHLPSLLYSYNSSTHYYNSPVGLYTSSADLTLTIPLFESVMSSVHLVNVNVNLLHPIKTLLPWTILQVGEINYSIKDFFLNTVITRLSDDSYCLEGAQIGRDKSILDNVDINLPILPVISSFGLYLRYSVSSGNGTSSIANEVIETDANASHPLSSVLHPIQQERTQKDKLYNDLINYLASFSVSLKATELEEGKKLVVTLQNIFWHIDGHQPNCTICKPVRLPRNIFEKLHHIPHPTPGDDGHYLPFHSIFGSATTEEFQPSFKAPSKPKRSKRKLAYYASVQHVKNAQLMLQCSECQMWRLIFSKYKLSKEHRNSLQLLLDKFDYSCGASLKDLDLPSEYADVDVRDHDCNDVIEKLYYSANLTPICVYCGKEEPYTDDKKYPQCSLCKEKPPVTKK